MIDFTPPVLTELACRQQNIALKPQRLKGQAFRAGDKTTAKPASFDPVSNFKGVSHLE